MKRFAFLVTLALIGAGVFWVVLSKSGSNADKARAVTFKQKPIVRKQPGKFPSDWFGMQRAYPFDTVSQEKILAARQFAKVARAEASLKKSVYATPVWQQAGPRNIPGRIEDIEAVPSNPAIVYAGSSAGGLFKSTDYGVTWSDIFDAQNGLSIGDIAIDPNNSNVIWVGTGESSPGFDSYDGTGIYKSEDAGLTWTYKGLPDSYRFGRVIVDPTNSNRVFAAVGGRVWGGGNPERGLYRTEDGGATWQRILYTSDTTACIDVALHPTSGVMLAAMWERIRYPLLPRRVWGPTSTVLRSPDRGNTWATIPTRELDLPMEPGRIGVTIDPGSQTMYVNVSNSNSTLWGVYKSTDLGVTWDRVNDQTLVDAPLNGSWSGGWYFSEIVVAPNNPNTVFALGLDLWRSTTGGSSWQNVSSSIHVDHHCVWVNPSNPMQVYNGCDGGVNYSNDGGNTWVTRHGQPSTQFYAITIDYQNPWRIYGGTQDNGTNRTLTGDPDSWDHIWGGDGFYCAVDPTNPNSIFVESQYGNIVWSWNLGQDWGYFQYGIDRNNDRFGWNVPYMFDPVNPAIMYYGSNRLYRLLPWQEWYPITGDLTGGPYTGNSFGTITTIDVSKTSPKTVYVGTDDGYVWRVSNISDYSSTATRIGLSLPQRWVTRVAVDQRHANIVYVTLSGHYLGSEAPHIFRSIDYGSSFVSITGNLPDVPVNDIIPDPVDSQALFIATDIGVYASGNLGATWEPVGTGMPILPVADLAYHPPSRKLVAGTHGKSIFTTTAPCFDLTDSDGDGVGNSCDNCLSIANADQADIDFDYVGDACDPCVDPDQDGYTSPGYLMTSCAVDNCPTTYNPSQADWNNDGVGDACAVDMTPVYDTLPTTCTQLVVASQGEIGQNGATGTGLDFVAQGDCADRYLYTGSPLVSQIVGSDTAVYSATYAEHTLGALLGDNPAVAVTDSGDCWYYRTATLSPAGLWVGIETSYWAPKDPALCEVVIQGMKIYSLDGQPHSRLMIGELLDWDVPTTQENWNVGVVDAIQKLVGLKGEGTGCLDNSLRLGGQFMLGYRSPTAQCPSTSVVPHSAFSGQVSLFTQAGGQIVPGVTRQAMAESGFRADNYAGDQFTLMSCLPEFTLAATDTHYVYTALISLRQSGGGHTTEVINATKAWFQSRFISSCSCCLGITGNCDGSPDDVTDGSDLQAMVDFVFFSAPLPGTCFEENDVSGDQTIDGSDLQQLIDYVFFNFPAVNCP